MTTPAAHILVVDDDPGIVSYLVEMLEDVGYRVDGETVPARALERVAQESFDLVISDVEMPGMRGTDLLQAIHRVQPEQLVLLITAFGDIELAVQCVRAGACDFVAKPFTTEVLLHAIRRALRERERRYGIVRLREQYRGPPPSGIVARSKAMRAIVTIARKAAVTASTVLLTGESGSGKGAIARFIHEQGARREAPFQQVNCAAIPANLVESELFGVRKGAFTDAREDRPGLFAEADQGTLFLDEIAELPPESQAKLLHTLETGEVRAVGDTRTRQIDTRVIAATNRALEAEVDAQRFRADLFYRLNVIRIEIPPLRERVEDIEGLVDVFLDRAATHTGRRVTGISREAMRWLRAYDWPGNVRELANVIERALALTDHDTIVLEDLSPADSRQARANFLNDAVARGLPLESIERMYIEKVLAACAGNKVRAAQVLGIDRRTLYRKLGEGKATTD